MSDDLDPRILAKWLAGDLDPAAQDALDHWVASDPTHVSELDQIRELWRRAGEAVTSEEAPDASEAARWAAILGAIRPEEQPRMPAGRTLRLELPSRRRPIERWVAAAVLALTAGGAMWLGGHSGARQVVEVPPSERVYETARGERAEFRLIDGTRVMLNVASRLRVPANFGEGTRDVYLEGAAYFDVVHDSVKPFAVYAGDLVARDLGTQFTVGAYPEQRHPKVVVREGLVSLQAAAAPVTAAAVTLRPGEQGGLDDHAVLEKQPADTTSEFAWTVGVLVFDGTPLHEALPQLGRWFDLEFRLSDSSLNTIHLAATLTNQPTDDALHFLATSLGLRAERRGRTVILSSPTGRSHP